MYSGVEIASQARSASAGTVRRPARESRRSRFGLVFAKFRSCQDSSSNPAQGQIRNSCCADGISSYNNGIGPLFIPSRSFGTLLAPLALRSRASASDGSQLLFAAIPNTPLQELITMTLRLFELTEPLEA